MFPIDWTLRKRLLSVIFLISFGLLVVSAISLVSLNSVVTKYSHLANVSIKAAGHLSGMRARSKQVVTELVIMLAYKDKPEIFARGVENLAKNRKRYFEIEAEYDSDMQGFHSGDEQKFFDEVQTLSKAFGKETETLNAIATSSSPDRFEKLANLVEQQLIPLADKHQKSLLALDDFHVEEGAANSNAANDLAKKAKTTVIALSISILLVALTIAFWISNGINNQIRTITQRLLESSRRVSKASEDFDHLSADLSSRVNEQAAAVQETLTAADEVAAMVAKNSESVDETLKKALTTKQVAESGHQAVKETHRSVQEMNATNREMSRYLTESSKEISDMVAVIKNIGEKTKIINDIVFQTKLLSFNASVEAARAGESGKGFSVVAEEVGNLAALSGQASSEISNLLDESLRRAEAVVVKTKDNVEKIVASADKKSTETEQVIQRCLESLKSILTEVDGMHHMTKSIATASEEQSVGVKEISKAMGEIDSISHMNAQSADDCSNSAKDLGQQVLATQAVIEVLGHLAFGRSYQMNSTGGPQLPIETKDNVEDGDDAEFTPARRTA